MQPRHAIPREPSPQPYLEALEDGFCVLDPAWRITYWNAAAERMLATPRARVIGRVVWDAFPYLRGSVTWSHLQRVRQDGAPIRFIEVDPPGSVRRYTSVHAAPLPDGGLAIHFRDATQDVRRAEQYAALLESIRDGFVAVDANWRLVYLNAVAESLLRFPRDRALGVPVWTLLPRGPAEIGECLRATMADGIQRHLREVRPEGRVYRGRVFDLWTYPLAGGGISIRFEDVSERLQREGELARLAAEAQEANQAKSRFFAAVSHELRTPLNAIIGYTHLLGSRTYGDMPEPAVRAAVRAAVCAEHLSRLVDDVLLLTTSEISRVQVFPEVVDLRAYLPAIAEPLRLQALAKGLAFDLSLPADLPEMETDPQRLRQLLVALLSNAVKFTSRGSVGLTVSLRPAECSAAGKAGMYDLFPDPEVEFVVSDTGPGVSPADRERIFGPFEQLGDPARSDSMTHGSGLGLTVARQIARMLGGELTLSDATPRGSRFRFLLPLRSPR